MRNIISLCLCLILTLLLTPSAPVAQAYKVTQLEFPPELNAHTRSPFAINNNGQIVGYYENGLTFDTHGFIFENGAVRDLGLEVTAWDINDNGDILIRRNSNYYLLHSGLESVLFGPNGELANVISINKGGAIVGSFAAAEFAQYVTHALLITGGQAYDIGTLEGYDPTIESYAASINDLGLIVGASETSESWLFGYPVGTFGFVYEDGVMSSLGYLDTISGGRGLNSSASDINSAGEIVGIARERRAFSWPHSAVIWRDGKIKSLHPAGRLTSTARAINESGDVVGSAYQPTLSVRNAAWFWQGGNGMGIPLNSQIPSDAGVYLTFATDINDSGQIICNGFKILDGVIAQDTFFAFLLTPGKTLTLLDAKGDTLKEVTVKISKVANDPPVFTELPLGDFTSDQNGLIRLISSDLDVGDSIKVSLLVHSEPAARHKEILATMYSVTLDNAQIDNLGFGRIIFDEIDGKPNQSVTLNHTVIAWNLVASVEWDADLDYLQSTMDGFGSMSNYLYDVTDGQMRLDTVVLLDNKDYWSTADMRIYASNMEWPGAQADGIRSSRFKRIYMPRAFFLFPDDNRNKTYSDIPLNLDMPHDYRARAHEFGHYALGFYDEYQFTFGSSRCNSVVNYGYMDNGSLIAMNVYSSELSSQLKYALNECRNTKQYSKRGMSCWDYAEHIFEGSQGSDNIYVPIIKPDERGLEEVGVDFVYGPNGNLHNGFLTVDVGTDLVFPIQHTAPVTRTLDVGVYSIFTGNPVAKAKVKLKKKSGRVIKQGETADIGRIRVLGAETGDKVRSFGRKVVIARSSLSGTTTQTGDGWYSGEATIGGSGVSRFGNRYSSSSSGESMDIILKEVAGEYPLIVDAAFVGTELQLQMDVVNTFPQEPRVEHDSDSDTSISAFTFSTTTNGYSVSIIDSLGVNGVFTILAVDDSLAEFFVPVDYSFNIINDGADSIVTVRGPRGSVEVDVDSTADTVMFIVSAYPVIRNGLDPEARQAGDASTLIMAPLASLAGVDQLIIRYQDSDLGDSTDIANLESTLRMHRWDVSIREWAHIGGSVDTAFNEVTAAIDKAGVYAAFTTDLVTDVNDDTDETLLPESLQLRQNFPNPFNPTTSISFSIPAASQVKLEVFNILGQSVAILHEGPLRAGVHNYSWDGSLAASGVYLYRLTAGKFVESKKMLLLK